MYSYCITGNVENMMISTGKP